MMTTAPTEQQTETVAQHPDYAALSQKDRDEVDKLVESTQSMQDETDRWCGVMGGPVFFLARMVLHHDLQIRTLKQENRELLMRLRSLEDRVS